MNIHKNARLTPPGREEMALAVIKSGLSKTRTAPSVDQQGARLHQQKQLGANMEPYSE
jgi:hypothetical protein